MTSQEVKNRIAYLKNKIARIDASLEKMWGKPEMTSRYMSCMEIAGKAEKELEQLEKASK
jgi:hypothetical protein